MPVLTTTVATTDPDVAHAAMNAVYAPVRPIVYAGSADELQFSMTSMQSGVLHAGRMRHTMATRTSTPAFDDLVVATFLSGGMRWRAGSDTVAHGVGGVGRFPTATGMAGEWEDVDREVVRIPMPVVADLAAARADVEPERFDFHGVLPVSPAAAGRWRSLSSYVQRALVEDWPVLDSPLVHRELVDLVATTALDVFPNTTLTGDPRPGPGWVGPASLRRAVAHIEGHLREPITVGEVAAAAGTTGLALQAAFRRHLGTGPMGYARRLRLEGAHRDLQAADPASGTTVPTVAAAWGFASTARFVERYRQRFGGDPAATLRS